MTTPRVTELPQQLEAVQPDTFIDARPRSAVPGPRLAERAARERRLELVRRVMRVSAAAGRTSGGARNGSGGDGTERP